MTQEQYEKVHAYLLDNNQQELAGHLDGLWQELASLRANRDEQYSADHSKQAGESVQQFQDRQTTEPTAAPTNDTTTSEPTPNETVAP